MEETNLPSNTDIIPLEASFALCEEGKEVGQVQEMEFHPLCKLFPPLSDKELEDLADDIKAHGQLEPILTINGMILDGGNRYKACLLAGVEPRLEEYKGGEPLEELVVSKNMKRRHLKPSQRAMIVAELEKFGHGGKRQGANVHLATRSEAARKMEVSPRLVASAKVVKEKGSPDLIEAVRRGEKSVSEAEAEIKKAAGDGKAKATAEDADNKVTGEQTKARGKPSGRLLSFTDEQAAGQLIDWLVDLCPPGQRAELAELAEEAESHYGQFCWDFADRLRKVKPEVDQREGAEAL